MSEPVIDEEFFNPEMVDGGWLYYRCRICSGETLLQGGWKAVLRHFRKVHPDLDQPKKPTERMLASPIRTTLRVIPAHYSFPTREPAEPPQAAGNVLQFRPRGLKRPKRPSGPDSPSRARRRPLSDFTDQGTLFDLDDTP